MRYQVELFAALAVSTILFLVYFLLSCSASLCLLVSLLLYKVIFFVKISHYSSYASLLEQLPTDAAVHLRGHGAASGVVPGSSAHEAQNHLPRRTHQLRQNLPRSAGKLELKDVESF